MPTQGLRSLFIIFLSVVSARYVYLPSTSLLLVVLIVIYSKRKLFSFHQRQEAHSSVWRPTVTPFLPIIILSQPLHHLEANCILITFLCATNIILKVRDSIPPSFIYNPTSDLQVDAMSQTESLKTAYHNYNFSLQQTSRLFSTLPYEYFTGER